MPMIAFETVSIFIETKSGIAFTTGNMSVAMKHCRQRSLVSFWLGMWSIPSNPMSDIGVYCTLTNLHCKGVNLDSAEV